MTVRCIRCGTPVTGLTQLCDDCAAQQRRPWESPQPQEPEPSGSETGAQPPAKAAGPALAVCRRCGTTLVPDRPVCWSCGERLPTMGAEYADHAGFWIRFLAFIVDSFILFVVGLPFALFIHGLLALIAVRTLVGAAYTIGFWVARGATPGKMAMNLQIVMVDGGPITGGKAALRYLGYFANGVPLGLGWLLVGTSQDKRGLHDHMAGTMVVRKA